MSPVCSHIVVLGALQPGCSQCGTASGWKSLNDLGWCGAAATRLMRRVRGRKRRMIVVVVVDGLDGWDERGDREALTCQREIILLII